MKERGFYFSPLPSAALAALTLASHMITEDAQEDA